MLQGNFDVNMLETRSVSIQFLLKSPGSRVTSRRTLRMPFTVVAVSPWWWQLQSSHLWQLIPWGPGSPYWCLAGNGWEWGLLG